MQQSMIQKIQIYAARNKYRRIFRKFVQILACVVVFCTTYALILPAITMEQNVFCGLEEHVHDVECYQSDNRLICTEPAVEGHIHNESCYILPAEREHVHTDVCEGQVRGDLICTIPEAPGHVHGDSCYTVSDSLECSLPTDHVHGDNCRSYPLVCTLPTDPHIHSESCLTRGDLICGLEAGHIHDSECREQVLSCNNLEEGHEHTDDCYTAKTVCVIPENHSHEASCYEFDIVCGIDEGYAHTHDDACYGTEAELTCNLPELHIHNNSCFKLDLTCTTEESPGHSHDDSCYQMISGYVCGKEAGEMEQPEPELICTEPAVEGHVHVDSCYEAVEPVCGITDPEHIHTEQCRSVICGLEAHSHTLACYSDPEADVESAAVWESTFAHVALTGDWPTDVVAIAETQIGYTESTRNYEVWEDNSIHGYTRYGAWYGVPYGDWCGMFASFCLDYAGVEGMPYNYGVRPWIEDLASRGLYYSTKETKAQKGNLIFFDWEGDGLSDHVGIVAEVQEAQEHTGASIKAIEGNASNCVKYVYYSPDDPEILGYGLLPGQAPVPVIVEQPDEEENSALLNILICGMRAHTHSDYCYLSDGTCICTREEHTHTIDCVHSSIPVGFADGGAMMRMLFAAQTDSNITYHTDIAPLFTGVEIYDSNNVLVYASVNQAGTGTVTIGEDCRIKISFGENTENQFSTDGSLIYKIPVNLSAGFVGTGVIRNRNNTIIATYQINGDQLVITPVLVEGKNFFGEFNNVTMTIDFEAEVIHSSDSDFTEIDFNGNYKVTVNVTEDAKVDAKKQQMEYDPNTQTITYKCTVTAFGGNIPLTYISDWWSPDHISVIQDSIKLTDKDGNGLDMNNWFMESDEKSFKLIPNQPVTLAHNEFITLTYQVKVDDDIVENFKFDNSFYVFSDDNGNQLEDTDTITTPVVVTNVEKNGVHETEIVDGVEQNVLKWTVKIDNPNMDTITITDQLGEGQTFCKHQPIAIKAIRPDGSVDSKTAIWDNDVQTIGNTQFNLALPTLIYADNKNEYTAYELTYYSHFELDADNDRLQVFDNTVTTNVLIGNKPTIGTGSVGVIGVPPGIEKTADSDNEWITFTINCRMPGALYNQPNVLIYDSLSSWANETGYYFQQNPDSMRVTITPDGGTSYDLEPYVNQDSTENTYLLVNDGQDFTIYFNTDQPVASESVWKCLENSTLTISYRVSRNAPLLDDWGGKPTGETLQDFFDDTNLGITNLAKLDYAPGYSVQDDVYHTPKPKPKPPLTKTAEVATDEKGSQIDGVYNYSVMFDTGDEESCIFQPQLNDWKSDINTLSLSDTFDSRMEYVSGSIKVTAWNRWDGYEDTYLMATGKVPSIVKNGNTYTMTVNAADLIATEGWMNGQTLIHGMKELVGGRFEFTYQLRVKDSEKQTATVGALELDNTATIEWTDRDGPKSVDPAHNQVVYDTGVLQKGMETVEDSNVVKFTILVNQNALALSAEGDSYVLYDTMSSNLLLLYDSLTVDILDKTAHNVKNTLTPAQCQFAYNAEKNQMTFILPDKEVIRLTYQCKVDGLGGTTTEISNHVELKGHSAIQDIVSSEFVIKDHQGSADGSSKSFHLQKQDGNNHSALAGVTFSLYGNVAPSDNSVKTILVKENDKDRVLYYYGSFTTGQDGMASISHTMLTPMHLYALVEEAPPNGYVALSEPYVFYMHEREPGGSMEIDCIADGQLVVIENYPMGYELPSTGGVGGGMYTVGGTLLMLAALILLYNQKKCRKEDYRSS